MKNNILLCTCR